VRGKPGAWFARRADIARHFVAHGPKP
jgi:hypothetical protein